MLFCWFTVLWCYCFTVVLFYGVAVYYCLLLCLFIDWLLDCVTVLLLKCFFTVLQFYKLTVLYDRVCCFTVLLFYGGVGGNPITVVRIWVSCVVDRKYIGPKGSRFYPNGNTHSDFILQSRMLLYLYSIYIAKP